MIYVRNINKQMFSDAIVLTFITFSLNFTLDQILIVAFL